jgi:hypothetical protein
MLASLAISIENDMEFKLLLTGPLKTPCLSGAQLTVGLALLE